VQLLLYPFDAPAICHDGSGFRLMNHLGKQCLMVPCFMVDLPFPSLDTETIDGKLTSN
jgi:hypothetical protein